MAMYFPSWLQSLDSIRFARVVPAQIFGDYWMPAVYAIFVKGIQEVAPTLWVTIAVQHLIGLSVGVILYLAMRLLGAKPWLACVPAAAAFLVGDQIWIEHQIMSEPFVTALIAGGLACTLRGLVPQTALRWLAAGSVLLILAGLSRNIALTTLPIAVLCVAFWVRGPLRARATALATVIVPALVVLGLYVAAFEISGGQYLGLADMRGWNLYARTAPFADCDEFTPPPGTQVLCESTPSAERLGSLGYQWDTESVGRREFELGPETSPIVGEFGQQALLHQPLDYLEIVATDAARYLDPSIGPDRYLSGQPASVQSFGLIDPATRAFVEEYLSRVYDGTDVHVHGREALATYQDMTRPGWLLAPLLIFALLGMAIARGPVRLAIFLFGLTALALYLVPVFVLSYEFRYGLPPQPFLVAAGTLGIAALLSRRYPTALFEERLSETATEPEPAAAAP